MNLWIVPYVALPLAVLLGGLLLWHAHRPLAKGPLRDRIGKD